MAIEALSYAVRPRVVGLHIGQLAILLAGFGSVPLAVAALLGDWPHALGYAVAVALLLGPGWLLQRLPSAGEVQQNEALVVVAAIFVIATLAFSIPMMASGIAPLDALFEAASGITTTGLSTFATVEDKPHSLVFTAAWLQWLGGMSIMVLSFALLFGQSISAKRLTSVVAEEKGLGGGSRAYAMVIVRIYTGLTVLGILGLWLAGLDLFHAVSLVLSAVSTGGFSPYNSSIGGLGPAVQGGVIALCFAGAIAMPLYRELLQGNWRQVVGDLELRALLVAGLAVTGALLLAPSFSLASGEHRLAEAAILAFSAQSTAGFSSFPPASLDSFSKIIVILAMASGGGVGSSAGGIKLVRLLVLFRVLQFLISRSRLPQHAVARMRLGGRDWDDSEVVSVLAIVALFLGVVLLSWLPFVWFGYDPLDALFEVVSATGTVGLSSGLTRLELEPLLKGVLCIDMLLGRLEILALLVLLAPGTWIGRRRGAEASDSEPSDKGEAS